ncbi:Protein kinase C-like 1 [Geranomyces michiganensis]|nr:Protein kinase C-like 1 [Geranomyces michiganensis]
MALLSLAARRIASTALLRPAAAAPVWASSRLACRQFASVSSDISGSLKNAGITLSHIKRNPSVDLAYADACKNEKGTKVTSSGALAALSGAKTGRSPTDKRIVDEPSHSSNIWWGPVNVKLSPESFQKNRKRALDYLNGRDQLYVVDGYAGADPKYQLKIRIICSRAYHALFMHNMLIRPTKEQLETFGEPDFTIFNAGATPADTSVEGVASKTSVALSFDKKEMVILGTEYAGEMKKGVFTILHYLMPQRNVLSLHTSANEGINAEKDVSFFFGLSGTGKTTLSADPQRRLIGDDEHCWSDKGVFNIEGGCYAKAVDLSAEKEPEIFHAIRKGSVLENVIMDKNNNVDYSNTTITENTRACYPIDFIPNAKIPSVGGHPKNIILLTCDAFGVLPPVSKLTTEQAMYHFISGYTAKIAGTEEGVTEPSATFSACFGQPFLVWHPMKYAEMLAQKLKEHGTAVWLVNSGWTGGKYGTGKRIPLKYSRAIIDAIHNGELTKSMSANPRKFPVFNLAIPAAGGVKGVPDAILNPSEAWSDKKAFEKQVAALAGLFGKNFDKFGSAVENLKKAGPVL